MTTRERRNGGRRRSVLFSSDPDYSNPMDSLLNLSDVMLVLAVGIMLALILRPSSVRSFRLNTGGEAGEEDLFGARASRLAEIRGRRG